jgi:PucR family transcriptional regulator, purine catabolism regulatory protein
VPGVRLTLAEVLGEDEFGLVLRSGSPATLTRAVAGAETVEVDRPVELSAGGYIVLTTGVRLRGHPDLQRRLVAESEARGVAAIGFGIGLVFRSTPRALLEEARRRAFPVFEVPFEVPFRDIIAYINRSHLSDDFYSLKRTVTLQRTLLGALEEARPEEALIGRLATIVGGGAILYRPAGVVVTEAGGAPAAAVWEALDRRRGDPEPFEVEPWQVTASPIVVDGEVRFWLALAGRSEPAAAGITRPLVQVTERLLRVIELARDARVMEERVRRSELLRELLDERRAPEVSPERLELFGFSPSRPWRVALIAVDGWTGGDGGPAGGDGVLADALRVLGGTVAGGGRPHLLGQHRHHLALVFEEGDDGLPVERWTAALGEAGIEARAAVGRPVRQPGGLLESRGDALLALDFLRRMGAASGRVLCFEEFAFIDALLAAADPAQLGARTRVVLDPLRNHPQLFETLVTYLAADLNVNDAAERLHIHANSLRYRLSRVEEALGRPLRSLATVVDLYVALRAEARFGDG